MGDLEVACPACGLALRATSLSGVVARVCGQCHGALVAQIDMIRLLEAMSVELLQTLDPDTKLEPVGKADDAVACPSCKQTMARDNYCGAGIAHFDRCEACRLLWLGADELGTMTMMWARMEKRLERTQRVRHEGELYADGLLLSRAVRGAWIKIF